MRTFAVGDKVWYRGQHGRGPRVAAIIEEVETDEDFGDTPQTYGCVEENDCNKSWWGYPDQFTPRD